MTNTTPKTNWCPDGRDPETYGEMLRIKSKEWNLIMISTDDKKVTWINNPTAEQLEALPTVVVKGISKEKFKILLEYVEPGTFYNALHIMMDEDTGSVTMDVTMLLHTRLVMEKFEGISRMYGMTERAKATILSMKQEFDDLVFVAEEDKVSSR